MAISGKFIRTAGERDTVSLLLAYVNELQASIASMKTSMDTLVAKLNADTGVADTNYSNTGAVAAPSLVETYFE